MMTGATLSSMLPLTTLSLRRKYVSACGCFTIGYDCAAVTGSFFFIKKER